MSIKIKIAFAPIAIRRGMFKPSNAAIIKRTHKVIKQIFFIPFLQFSFVFLFSEHGLRLNIRFDVFLCLANILWDFEGCFNCAAFPNDRPTVFGFVYNILFSVLFYDHFFSPFLDRLCGCIHYTELFYRRQPLRRFSFSGKNIVTFFCFCIGNYTEKLFFYKMILYNFPAIIILYENRSHGIIRTTCRMKYFI